ncbi:MAG TPA: HigA family addiction module antitoxin [Spirochaetota bacterium]|nr:HigA family addiction module antitoxin [Spirochaetota bacterium]HPN13974.1 HigA family addiction module antitoxin [Spirochaetota bacterium]
MANHYRYKYWAQRMLKKLKNETINAGQEPRPRHPGEILKAEYLDPMGITQQELADYLRITRVRINEVLLGKRAISTDTAIRLARFFDTTVNYWLGMQTEVDLWDAINNNEEEYLKIIPLKELKKNKV